MNTSKLLLISALSSLAEASAVAQNSGVVGNQNTIFQQSGSLSVGLVSGGSGYTTAPMVMVMGGGGSGAVVRAVIDPKTQSVSSLEVVNAGSGYTSAPMIVISGGGGLGATAVAKLSSVSATGQQNGNLSVGLISGGSGYTSAPMVMVVGGGGSGAVVRAAIDPKTQSVSSLKVVNAGSGYTGAPMIVISGGGGMGATAVAKLTPSEIDQKPADQKLKSTNVDWKPVKGPFQSLLTRPDAPSGVAETPGRVTVTIGGKGAVSVSLEYEGAQYRFAGTLSAEAPYTKVLSRNGQAPLTITLSLKTAAAAGASASTELRASGVAVEVAEGQGELSSNAKLGGETSTPSQSPVSDGRYTMVYSGKKGLQGYAALESSRSGIVMFSGKTADGKLINSSALKQADGSVPFYQSFSGKGVPLGRLAGLLYIVSSVAESTGGSGVQGELELRVLGQSADAGISLLDVTGSRYTRPKTSAGEQKQTWEVVTPTGVTLSQALVGRANGTFKVDGANPLKLNIKLDVGNGMITGRYVDAAGNERRFDGMSLQDAGISEGFSQGAAGTDTWSLK